jgi:hypothetical protein
MAPMIVPATTDGGLVPLTSSACRTPGIANARKPHSEIACFLGDRLVNPFKAGGIAMAYKLIDATQARWPASRRRRRPSGQTCQPLRSPDSNGGWPLLTPSRPEKVTAGNQRD